MVDRLVRRDGIERRLTDSMETALGLWPTVWPRSRSSPASDDTDTEGQILTFSQHLSRPSDGKSFDELAPRNFSFNSPYGACTACDGLGTAFEVDPELVIPNPELSIGGRCHSTVGLRPKPVLQPARRIGVRRDVDPDRRPVAGGQTRSTGIFSLHGGVDRKVLVRYKNRYGRTRSYNATFEGIVPYLRRRHTRVRVRQCRGSRSRATCGRSRAPPATAPGSISFSLACTVDGHSIADICGLSIGEAAKVLVGLNLSDRDLMIAERVVKEINSRLSFLLDVGLDYLSLGRAASTLSAAKHSGSGWPARSVPGLVGVLYVLDEPSIGLHQKDNAKLIETLQRLRDIGNSVVVVEHDEETIMVADHVVDIGPGAGEHGGEIVYSGPVKGLLRRRQSSTGQYLSGKKRIPIPEKRRPITDEVLSVRGAREHNLRNIDVDIPLGCFVTVTGVSGSGKSTLINGILSRSRSCTRSTDPRHRPVCTPHSMACDHLDKVIDIDQSPIGRTPRSNPATYTGVFDHIRKLFAKTNESKIRGYQPGRFSFNVAGGPL